MAGGDGGVAFIRKAPRVDSEVLEQVLHGTAVTIVCTAYGDSVLSADGRVTTDLWNFIKPSGPVSVGGYIADTWVLTGTNDPTMPQCNGT
jgi:hypothetical protein